MTNILVALKNLVENPITDISDRYQSSGSNRANSAGDALEGYVKDLFCNTFTTETTEVKNRIQSEHFSYIGNQNNPPDMMIRNGDAIEVKKIESVSAQIALNSSYPKNTLRSESPMITQSCRECEAWVEKDLIYVIGAMQENTLKALWFIYGDCYAADNSVYNKTLKDIAHLDETKFEIDFTLSKIDCLNITTYSSSHGWVLENPHTVFNYLNLLYGNENLSVHVLIQKNKYDSFSEEQRKDFEDFESTIISIKDVQIKSPNNPARLLDAKLIELNL